MAGKLGLMKKSPVGQTERSERRFRWNKQYVRRREGLARQLSHKWTQIWSESALVSESRPHAHHAGAEHRRISSLLYLRTHLLWSADVWACGAAAAAGRSFCICRNLKKNEWSSFSACDDEKAIWQTFILRPSLLISRRETIHMFHSCSPLAERAIHLYYPWVELLRTTKCKNQTHVFSDKEGQDRRAWYSKELCFGGLSCSWL